MSAFDPTSFYRLANDAYPDSTLSSGMFQDSNGALDMTTFGSLSSENWQIYYQQGRYFIRNFDYGANWQLGLEKNSRSVPRLMQLSGSIEQQWTLAKQQGGKWTLTNGLLGNDSMLALVGGNGPGMQPSSSGAQWDITINLSAGSPEEPDQLKDLSDFEDPPSFTSATSTVARSSIATPTTAPSSVGTSDRPSPVAPSPVPPSPLAPSPPKPSPPNPSPTRSPLHPGATAGIAVGSVLLVALCGLLGYSFWRRRRRQSKLMPTELVATEKPVEMNSASSSTMYPQLEIYKYRAELDSAPASTMHPQL